MELIGILIEELMGDKFKSQYRGIEYSGRKMSVGIGRDRVGGKMNSFIAFADSGIIF